MSPQLPPQLSCTRSITYPHLSALSLACVASLLSAPAWAQTTPPAQKLERVEVIGATPVNGAYLRRNQIAAPVQSASDEDLNQTASSQ